MMTKQDSEPTTMESALGAIVGYLKREPPLLFSLGIALVIAMLTLAGISALEVIVPLLVVLVAGLGVWLVARRHAPSAARGGDVRQGAFSASQDIDVQTGGVARGTAGRGGDVRLGIGSRVRGVRIRTGGVGGAGSAADGRDDDDD